MTRTDNDSWDIATSVGATAVMVAMARAAETNSDDPLIRDEYAELLVSTPELAETRDRIAAMWQAADDRKAEQGDDPTMDVGQWIDYQAVRTHVFDEFFTSAAAAGIRQHVILAAGLDSRAYRLPWPDGILVYELDVPSVLEYKSATMTAAGISPKATRRDVAVDLRDDWPAAMRDAGFEHDIPTAWLAEGLLPFLPGQTQEAMFVAIDSLSAPGSRIAVEVFGVDEAAILRRRAERKKRGEEMLFDPSALWYDNEGRPDCAAWFAGRGWRTRTVDTQEEFERLGRAQSRLSHGQPPFGSSFVSAELLRQPVG